VALQQLEEAGPLATGGMGRRGGATGSLGGRLVKWKKVGLGRANPRPGQPYQPAGKDSRKCYSLDGREDDGIGQVRTPIDKWL
jgi:hypothetical protein